jgi:hypothetical protein
MQVTASSKINDYLVIPPDLKNLAGFSFTTTGLEKQIFPILACPSIIFYP